MMHALALCALATYAHADHDCDAPWVEDGAGDCCIPPGTPPENVSDSAFMFHVHETCGSTYEPCFGPNVTMWDLEICGFQKPTCVADADLCLDSDPYNCTAPCEMLEYPIPGINETMPLCAPPAGPARDAVDCVYPAYLALMAEMMAGCPECMEFCPEEYSDCMAAENCSAILAAEDEPACLEDAVCTPLYDCMTSWMEQSDTGGQTCNFGVLMEKVAAAVASSDVAGLSFDPTYQACADVASAIGDAQIASSCP